MLFRSYQTQEARGCYDPKRRLQLRMPFEYAKGRYQSLSGRYPHHAMPGDCLKLFTLKPPFESEQPDYLKAADPSMSRSGTLTLCQPG